jgi:hypothetical protein
VETRGPDIDAGDRKEKTGVPRARSRGIDGEIVRNFGGRRKRTPKSPGRDFFDCYLNVMRMRPLNPLKGLYRLLSIIFGGALGCFDTVASAAGVSIKVCH